MLCSMSFFKFCVCSSTVSDSHQAPWTVCLSYANFACTLVADKRMWRYIKKFIRLHWDYNRLGVRYPIDVKSAAFRFHLETSRVSSQTEELWNKETDRLAMTIYMLPLVVLTLVRRITGYHICANAKLFL